MSLAIRQRNLPSVMNRWQVHHGRDETFRVAAPCPKTSNRTAPIGADGAVIAAHNESCRRRKDVLKRISTVSADLQHATVKAQIRILCLTLQN